MIILDIVVCIIIKLLELFIGVVIVVIGVIVLIYIMKKGC